MLISQRERARPISLVGLWNVSRSVVWMIYNLSSSRAWNLVRHTVDIENLKKKQFFGLKKRILRIFVDNKVKPKKYFEVLTAFHVQYVLDSGFNMHRLQKKLFCKFFTRKIKYWVNLLDFFWNFAERSVWNSIPW